MAWLLGPNSVMVLELDSVGGKIYSGCIAPLGKLPGKARLKIGYHKHLPTCLS